MLTESFTFGISAPIMAAVGWATNKLRPQAKISAAEFTQARHGWVSEEEIPEEEVQRISKQFLIKDRFIDVDKSILPLPYYNPTLGYVSWREYCIAGKRNQSSPIIEIRCTIKSITRNPEFRSGCYYEPQGTFDVPYYFLDLEQATEGEKVEAQVLNPHDLSPSGKDLNTNSSFTPERGRDDIFRIAFKVPENCRIKLQMELTFRNGKKITYPRRKRDITIVGPKVENVRDGYIYSIIPNIGFQKCAWQPGVAIIQKYQSQLGKMDEDDISYAIREVSKKMDKPTQKKRE